MPPFSFHCNICYEPFNTSNRPPVVLPCGHTFLCATCSKQLKNCMECRRPLFTTSKRNDSPLSTRGNSASEQNNHASAYSRSSYTPSYRQRSNSTGNNNNSNKRATPLVKEPLPIPKNHVLMALMETAEKKLGGQLFEEDEDKVYESGDDDECVLTGIQHLTSDAGTYVIRDPNGLLLYPQEGKEQEDESQDCAKTETTDEEDEEQEDEDCSISSPRNHMLQQSSGELATESHASMEVVMSPNPYKKKRIKEDNNSPKKSPAPPTIPIRLPYGTRIQVLSFKHRKAQLSRKRGYIRVLDEKQLVKVGDFMDKASEVESLLASIVKDKQDLQHKIKRMERKMKDYVKMENQLTNELQEMEKEESENAHPDQHAICGAVAVVPTSTTTISASTNKDQLRKQSSTSKMMLVQRTNSQESYDSKASLSEAEIKNMGNLFLEMAGNDEGSVGSNVSGSHTSSPTRRNMEVDGSLNNKQQGGIVRSPSSVVRHLPSPRISNVTGEGSDVVGLTPSPFRKRSNSEEIGNGQNVQDLSLPQATFDSPGRKGGSQPLSARTPSETTGAGTTHWLTSQQDMFFSSITAYQPQMQTPRSPPPTLRGSSYGSVLQSRSPSSSPVVSRGHVDFRTGMSGHYGLGRPSPKPKAPHQSQTQYHSQYMNQYQSGANAGSSLRSIRMMSEHRGAAQIGKLGKVPPPATTLSSGGSVVGSGMSSTAASFISRLDNTNTGTW
mmetsp:Transcript_23413/g.32816  ORF Transcript_23413/g.32816 Transcript_23413/m.32816 type:complete len:723 (+) Transcript_23413:360-2528(+)